MTVRVQRHRKPQGSNGIIAFVSQRQDQTLEPMWATETNHQTLPWQVSNPRGQMVVMSYDTRRPRVY